MLGTGEGTDVGAGVGGAEFISFRICRGASFAFKDEVLASTSMEVGIISRHGTRKRLTMYESMI